MPPTTPGGSRDAHVSGTFSKSSARSSSACGAIIVDDLVTSGAHIQAVAMVLHEFGVREVGAFTVGVTMDTLVADPWAPVITPLGPEGRE